MKHSYLVEVAQALTEEERQETVLELTILVQKKEKNAESLLKLFHIICAAAPEYREDVLDKDSIYARLFPGKETVKWKLEKLMSELNQFIRNLLVTKRMWADTYAIQRQLEWASWLSERGMKERALQIIEKAKSEQLAEGIESIQFYKDAFLIEDALHNYYNINNRLNNDLNIKNLLIQLELYYESYKFEIFNRYLLQGKAVNLAGLEHLIDESYSKLEGSKLLKVIKKIHDLLGRDSIDISEADQLLESIQKMEHNISTETLDTLFAYLRNFYTILINNGNAALLPILHKTNLDNLERGFFYTNNKISPYAYLNICIVACRVSAFDWAEKFTEGHKTKIQYVDPDNIPYHYNMAYCLFAQRKFEQAMSFIVDTPSHSHYHQKFRRMELQIYYELESELLLYKIDAFRKFMERTGTKIFGKPIKEMNVEFVKVLLQIAQSPPKDKIRSARLIARIESKKLIAEKRWLLEKARELG